MSLTNLNSSNSKSMIVNSGTFRSGVYITSHNQYLTYTDNNGILSAYYYVGTLPYTTTSSIPDNNWKKMFITEQYSYLKSDIVPVISGGTGASTPANARINLGLGPNNKPIFSSLELSDATPYIDFHFGNSSADYTSRIIEGSQGKLTIIGGLNISSDLYAKGVVTFDNALTIENGGTGAKTNTTARSNLDVYSKAETNSALSVLSLPNQNTGAPMYYKLGNLKSSGNNPGYTVFHVYGANGIGSRVTNMDYITLSARGIDSITSANISSYLTHTRFYDSGVSALQLGFVKLADNTVDIYICSTAGYWNSTKVRVQAAAGVNNYITGDIATQIATQTWSATVPDGYTIVPPQNFYTSKNIIPITNGGTGASTEADARTNLGLGSSSSPTFQSLSISNTGNTIINLNSAIIRANSNNALILSNTGGLYFRPAGDVISTPQINYTQAGDFQLTGSTLTLQGTGGNLSVGGNSTISGSTTIGGTLSVSDAVTITKSLTVTEGIVGNSTLSLSGNVGALYYKAAGTSSLSPGTQGAYINWNQSIGSGKTDFINHRGGGTGGFNFWNGTSTQSLILQITSNGNIITNNNVGLLGYNKAGTSLSLAKVDSNDNAVFGSISIPAIIDSSINPTVRISSVEYPIYTTNNKPVLSAYKCSYLTSAGSDLKQTLASSNTPQTVSFNTIQQDSSLITTSIANNTVMINSAQGIMLSVSAQVIRESSAAGETQWVLFIETSANGSTWNVLDGSTKIITLNTANEINLVDYTIPMQVSSGTYIRFRHATTDSTKNVSIISKDSLFAGLPISSGFTVGILTI